jgi:hypothetical protein
MIEDSPDDPDLIQKVISLEDRLSAATELTAFKVETLKRWLGNIDRFRGKSQSSD